MGETQDSGGLEMMMTNIRELQDFFLLLGLNFKLCPKLSCAKFDGPSGSDVKEELDSESKDNQFIKKNSSLAKMSSSNGKFTHRVC